MIPSYCDILASPARVWDGQKSLRCCKNSWQRCCSFVNGKNCSLSLHSALQLHSCAKITEPPSAAVFFIASRRRRASYLINKGTIWSFMFFAREWCERERWEGERESGRRYMEKEGMKWEEIFFFFRRHTPSLKTSATARTHNLLLVRSVNFHFAFSLILWVCIFFYWSRFTDWCVVSIVFFLFSFFYPHCRVSAPILLLVSRTTSWVLVLVMAPIKTFPMGFLSFHAACSEFISNEWLALKKE